MRVCLKKLEFTKEAIAQWAKTALADSARVVSDGLWYFKAVTASGATQERIVTGGGPACVKLEQFRAVNTFLGNLKTAYSGTYHAFDFAKYAHRYLAEVQYRFNRRFDCHKPTLALSAECPNLPNTDGNGSPWNRKMR